MSDFIIPEDTLTEEDPFSDDYVPHGEPAAEPETATAEDGTPLFDISDLEGTDLLSASSQLNIVTRASLIRSTTLSWLKAHPNALETLTPTMIEGTLLRLTNTVIVHINQSLEKDYRHEVQKRLTNDQIALLIRTLHHVVRIAPDSSSISTPSDPDNDILAMYVDDPKDSDWGTYQFSKSRFQVLVRRYDREASTKQCEEIMSMVFAELPRTTVNSDMDLIPVNNGIVDYRTKTLIPFGPQHVFTAKTRVNFNPQATNPIITNPDGTTWDVLSWVQSLSDDDGVPELLMQIAGAIVRPRVNWERSAWFYSPVGNNGKGTLCTLYRNLSGSAASISISQFGKEFHLSPLLRATAVIVDENPVGTFIDQSENFKAAVTNDKITINIKNRDVFDFQPYMFIVQCINERPQVKDKSDSFYRRLLIVPFRKTFGGRENKAIKRDYLARPEVLEFVLKYVLCDLPDYYELDTPEVCADELETYKLEDPVRSFFNDVVENLVWDVIPTRLLYSLYQGWYKAEYPSSSGLLAEARFKERIEGICSKHPTWEASLGSRSTLFHTKTPTVPEPFIEEYNLTKFMHSSITTAPNRAIWDKMPTRTRGIRRNIALPPAALPTVPSDPTQP